MAGLFGGGDVVVGHVNDPPMPGYTDILIDRSTVYGNEFRLSKYTRVGAISRFVAKADAQMDIKCEFRKRVMDLRARYLAGEKLRFLCHCAPRACHGSWYRDVCIGRVKVPEKPMFKLGSKLE